jgi:hypothetical protein
MISSRAKRLSITPLQAAVEEASPAAEAAASPAVAEAVSPAVAADASDVLKYREKY